MTVYEASVAKKYAQAFLNVVGERIIFDDYLKIRALRTFFEQNKTQLFFLAISVISDDKKIDYLLTVARRFGLNDKLDRLSMLLVADKRAFLMAKVLRQVERLYKKEHNIARFTVTSSHPLSKDAETVIKKFLMVKTGQTIIYEYMIDKKLLAGIRLQSETLLWEYSISEQLKRIQLPLVS